MKLRHKEYQKKEDFRLTAGSGGGEVLYIKKKVKAAVSSSNPKRRLRELEEIGSLVRRYGATKDSRIFSKGLGKERILH